MNDQDFTLSFSVNKTPEEAFAAIKNVRGWWGEGIEGSADAPGDTFRYRHNDLHDSTQELTESVPGTTLVWLVTDARLSFLAHKDEWKGTRLRFDLKKNGDVTDVKFTHVGLREASECFSACSKGWTFYVTKSLQALIATGKGQPDPRA